MNNETSKWSVPIFCVKFVVFVVVLVVLWWWLVLPFYGKLLLQVTGMPLKYLLKMNIESGVLIVDGVLNTKTIMAFVVDGHRRGMPIALLVTNLPPYVALVLATAGITLKRRILILLYGCGILCFFHASFIILALRLSNVMTPGSEIPTAVVQFFLTLPFMLWIVFAYWGKLTAFFSDSSATVPQDSKPADDDTNVSGS